MQYCVNKIRYQNKETQIDTLFSYDFITVIINMIITSIFHDKIDLKHDNCSLHFDIAQRYKKCRNAINMNLLSQIIKTL